MREDKQLLSFDSNNEEVQVKLLERNNKHFIILVSDAKRKIKNRKVHNTTSKDSALKEFHKIVSLLTYQV